MAVRRLVVVVAVAISALAAGLGSAAPVAGQSGGFDDVSDDAYYSLPVTTLAGRGVFGGTLCDDGFCPGKPIDRKTMAVWTVRVLDGRDPPTVTEARFDDVDATGFYAPFIERMAELGVTAGCGDGSRFCPDRNVTRAQMAVFLSRAYSLPEGPNPMFSDVPGDAWYASEVAKLAASGITAGCGDGTRFCPGGDTTRAQMAAFLFRADTNTRQATAPAGINSAIDGGGVIAAGGFHSCGLRVDRTIACWGANVSCGHAGGSINCRRTSSNGQSDAPAGEFVAVAAGYLHSCGLRTDQTLRCWGWNAKGQSDAPAGQFDTVSTSGDHSCGLRADQTITCWGLNEHGQANPPAGQFISVSAGVVLSCGVRVDHTAACWGSDEDGRSDVPSGRFIAVSTGGWHGCGLRADRTITCWGLNEDGQTDAPAGQFIAVSAGSGHSCGLRVDQTITCWGWNGHGRADAPAGEFIAVSAGHHHSCGLRTDQTATCWGSNSFGGSWHAGQSDAPAGLYAPDYQSEEVADTSEATSVTLNAAMDGGGVLSAGPTHSCGLRVDQTITCWGDNESGKANPPTDKSTAVVAGASHSCGLRTDQTITCWGNNTFGQLEAPSGTFAAITEYCGLRTDHTITCWGLNIFGQTKDAPSGTFLAVSAVGLHACGLRKDQTITCWPTSGLDLSGQPEAPAGKFTVVAAGNFHSCAVRTERTIRCWGANDSGQSQAPTGTFVSVAPGGFHSCGLRTDQTITCWGANGSGQSSAPAGNFLAVSAGQLHSCGLRVDRTITCWGSNEDLEGSYIGQLDVPSGLFGP